MNTATARFACLLTLLAVLAALWLGLLPAHAQAAEQKTFRAVLVFTTKYEGNLGALPGLIKAKEPLEDALRKYAKRIGFSDREIDFVVHTDAPGHSQALPATDHSVERSISDAAAKARPGDVLVVYMTGHGFYDTRTKQSWLFTTGGNEEHVSGKLNLQMQVMGPMKEKSNASVNLLFVDACQTPGKALGTSASAMGEDAEPGHIAAIFSSKAGQSGWVDERVGYGFFTIKLIEEISKNVASANELIDRISNPVRDAVEKAFPGERKYQVPVFLPQSSAGTYWLDPSKRPSEILKAAASAPPPLAGPKHLRFQSPLVLRTDIFSDPDSLRKMFDDSEVQRGMKVEWLPYGAVVPQHQVLLAVEKGTIDGALLIQKNAPKTAAAVPISCGPASWFILNADVFNLLNRQSIGKLYQLCAARK